MFTFLKRVKRKLDFINNKNNNLLIYLYSEYKITTFILKSLNSIFLEM